MIWSTTTAGYKPTTFLFYDAMSDSGQAPCSALDLYMDAGIDFKMRIAGDGVECANINDVINFATYEEMTTSVEVELAQLWVENEEENCIIESVFTPFNGLYTRYETREENGKPMYWHADNMYARWTGEVWEFYGDDEGMMSEVMPGVQIYPENMKDWNYADNLLATLLYNNVPITCSEVCGSTHAPTKSNSVFDSIDD